MMTRLIYSLAFYCITPFILLRLAWRSLREPGYRETIAQRFGFVSKLSGEPIWVHSVSAGETIAAVPLVKELLSRGHSVIVTTMTPTGRERVHSLLGDQVVHYYAPYDLPGSVKRFIKRTRPKAYIVIDTELWPNTIHFLSQQNIPCYLVNGRMSEKSARGYQRIASLSGPMLSKLRKVCVQSDVQGKRFLNLGVSNERLEVAGSIKFDVVKPDDFESRVAGLKERFKGRNVFLAASTHEGEEKLVLDAFRQVQNIDAASLLIIAPRHPHRSDEIQKFIEAQGVSLARHSHPGSFRQQTSVYLLDTMGELYYFYGIADIALIAGSLVDKIGGHNPMEPASLGVPMIMGRYRRNIDDIAGQFVESGAMEIVMNAEELSAVWQALVLDPVKRQQMASAGLRVMERNQGALDRVVRIVLAGLKS